MRSYNHITFCLLSIVASENTRAQTIVSIVPNSGYRAQAIATVITGQGTLFLPASPNINSIYLEQGATVITAGSVSAPNDTIANANFYIPSNAPLGYYDVHVNTANQGNLALTAGFQILLSDILENADGFFIKVYPNPTTTSLKIKSDKFNNIHVKILNVRGAVVYSGEFNNILNRQLDIPLGKHTPGTYLLEIETGNNTISSHRFVIMR